MALINCPECKTNLSDRATTCPSCGFPIREHIETEKKEEMKPKLPDKLLSVQNLDVGKKITNWLSDSVIVGNLEYADNRELSTGKKYIQLCENGLQIPTGLFSKIKIHDLQILNVFCDEGYVFEQRGGMMGKVALGTAIAGEFGAVMGVLSSKELTKKNFDYFNLRYWNLQTKELQYLSVKCTKGHCDRFINKLYKRLGVENLQNNEKKTNYILGTAFNLGVSAIDKFRNK